MSSLTPAAEGVERGTRGRARVTGDPAAAQQGLGVVMDRPARRDDHSVGVAQQVFGDHTAWRRGVRPSLEDHQVQLTRSELREPFRLVDLGDRRDDRGLGDRQVDHRRADEPAQHRREPTDAHRSAALPAERHGGALSLRQDLGHALALLGQRLAGRGQRETAPATAPRAVDEAQARLRFEPRQVLGHRRRSQVQRPRGGKDAAGALDGAQDEQAMGVHLHSVALNHTRMKVNFRHAGKWLQLTPWC